MATIDFVSAKTRSREFLRVRFFEPMVTSHWPTPLWLYDLENRAIKSS